jgi:hypothetical protein
VSASRAGLLHAFAMVRGDGRQAAPIGQQSPRRNASNEKSELSEALS